ncbi:MAG: hypothetical protein QM530_09165 [Phycisphaerales bacterium]|nr:hypothetical protein [Phycisphaerales bacterium]
MKKTTNFKISLEKGLFLESMGAISLLLGRHNNGEVGRNKKNTLRMKQEAIAEQLEMLKGQKSIDFKRASL